MGLWWVSCTVPSVTEICVCWWLLLTADVGCLSERRRSSDCSTCWIRSSFVWSLHCITLYHRQKIIVLFDATCSSRRRGCCERFSCVTISVFCSGRFCCGSCVAGFDLTNSGTTLYASTEYGTIPGLQWIGYDHYCSYGNNWWSDARNKSFCSSVRWR